MLTFYNQLAIIYQNINVKNIILDIIQKLVSDN